MRRLIINLKYMNISIFKSLLEGEERRNLEILSPYYVKVLYTCYFIYSFIIFRQILMFPLQRWGNQNSKGEDWLFKVTAAEMLFKLSSIWFPKPCCFLLHITFFPSCLCLSWWHKVTLSFIVAAKWCSLRGLRTALQTPLLLLLFSRSVVSDFLWPHGLQQARLPCPLPS